MEARIGVRRDPQNPNRKQKIFGFNAVIDTAIEMDLGLELPVACSTLAGNAHEGKHYIINREQILQYHEKTSKIDLADAKVLGLFGSGNTKGVFQFESGGMADLLMRIQPDD